MILIFSQNFDPSTDKVIDWLVHFKKPFIRINYNTDYVESVFLELSDDCELGMDNVDQPYQIDNYIRALTFTLTSGVKIDLKTINSVWYRRGGMPSYNSFFIDFSVLKLKFFIKKSQEYLDTEYNEIVRYIYFYLFKNCRVKNLGTPFLSASNKPQYLTLAKLYGLKIPNFYIVSRKSELKYALSKSRNNITKGISEMIMFAKDYLRLISYTSKIDEADTDMVDDRFFPSGIQKEIIKLADIRVVYLHGKCFSMAIFSQNNHRTSTDFRNYDSVEPNRNTPFKLPASFENKLKLLCEHIGLNFCSIDVLLDRDYQLYFLEINPVGQFGMVSMPCNYHIEKIIAEKL